MKLEMGRSIRPPARTEVGGTAIIGDAAEASERQIIVVRNGIVGKVVGSAIATALGTMLVNFLHIKTCVIWLMVAVLSAIGFIVKQPGGESKPSIIERVEDAAKKHGGTTLPVAVVPDRPNPVDAVAGKVADRAVSKVTEPIKDAGSSVASGARSIGTRLGDFAESVSDKARAWKEGCDREEHARLLVRAAELGLVDFQGWDLPKLRAEVAAANKRDLDRRYAERLPEWQRLWNGRCPRCRKPMHVSTRGTGHYICSVCGANVAASQARAQGSPPMPFSFLMGAK